MEIQIDSGLRLKLNVDDCTASVIKSPTVTGNVFIPQIILHENIHYKIISLGRYAFESINVQSITFPENSEIKTFEKYCFSNADIKMLQIPAELEFLEEGWCSSARNIANIEVSPKNKKYIYFENQFLLGKSTDKFDILYFARSDIETAVIPSQVKILKRYCLSKHYKLKEIIFPDNSEAKCIENQAFCATPIERLILSSKIEVISPSNFENLEKLVEIEISAKNKNFSVIDNNKYLVGKSDPRIKTFDQLMFCCRNVKNAKIPSYIKQITDYAFHSVKLQTLDFESNSSLEIIGEQAFIYCSLLKNIEIPASVKKLCLHAFRCASDLESILFLGKNLEFQNYCFSDCRKLKIMSFPNAIEINLAKNQSFGNIPKETKIFVCKDAKLNGPGIDKIRSQINYIEGKEVVNKKEIKKEEKNDKKEEKSSDKDRDIELLLSHIKYLESHLCKYEKIEPFDLESARNGEKEGKGEIQPKEKSFFIGEDDEESQEVIEKIGEGATSVAYKVYDKRNDRIICKKVLKTDEEQAAFKKLQNSMKEFEALVSLNHPCICEAIGFNMQEKVTTNDDKKNSKKEKEEVENDDDYEYEDDEAPKDDKSKKPMTTVALFMEFIPYKMKDTLEKGILNNTLKVRAAIDVAFGMSYIHQKGMMHRDLKLENIMLDYAYDAKIIDFDLVGFMNNDELKESLTKGIGTFAYVSPEMANEENYNNKTDVYSYGVVLFAIFTGHLPKQSLKDKLNKKPVRFPHSSSSISKYCIELIKKCIDYDINKRPSFDEIIDDMRQHSFRLADEIDFNIINQRYLTLDYIRKQNIFK